MDYLNDIKPCLSNSNMKRLSYIIIYLALMSLYACQPSELFTFTEPQPLGVSNMNNFPKRILGNYFSLSDKSFLKISDKYIIRINDFEVKFHPNELDSTERIIGDTLIEKHTNEKVPVRKDGDSLIYHIKKTDTLFQLNKTHILKQFKGYYFINTKYDTLGWVVKKLALSKGHLTISSISKLGDFKQLKAMSENPKDTLPPYKIKATHRQFRKLILNKCFSDDEIFV